MSAPVITSIAFDKPSYNPGDLITATIAFTPGSSPHSFTLTGTATDSATQEEGSLTAVFTVAETDATTVTASDDGSRVWTVTPVDAASATATATA